MSIKYSRILPIFYAVCLLSPIGEATAQQRPGRQIVEGLLKTLIESQLPQPEPSRAGNQPRRIQPALDRNLDPKIREAAGLLTAASEEMSQLVGSLQGDIYRAHGVRELLSDAMRLNANAVALSRRLAHAGGDSESLRASLRQLDQDWHALEYKLTQTENLSPQTLGHTARIQQYEAKIAAIFEMEQQVDLTAADRYITEMGTLFRALLEDIRYEVSDHNHANRLLLDGRDVYDSIRAFQQLARSNTNFTTLQQQFQRLESQWQRYNADLRTANNRHIQRHSQRISDANRQLHEIFRLQNELNRDDLVYATRMLQRDIDELLQNISLKMLTQLPAARGLAVASSSDLVIATGDFAETVTAGDGIDTLRDLYFYVYDEWQRLGMSLHGLSSQQANQSVRDIEKSMGNLQALLGVRPDFDRNDAINVASSLAGLARHVQGDIQSYFGRPNRYPRQFQTDALTAASEFYNSSRKLHNGLANGDKIRLLKTQCDDVSSKWEALNRLVPRFDLSEQQHLTEYRREITPKVVEMQTTLSL